MVTAKMKIRQRFKTKNNKYDKLMNFGISSMPILINPKTKQEEFYVRAPAATDKLEGRKLIEYIEHHWPS